LPIYDGLSPRHQRPLGAPDARVKRRLTETEDRFLFTSVLALAEIRQGLEPCERGKQRAALEEWLERNLPPSFETPAAARGKPPPTAGRHYRPGCKRAARCWRRLTA